MRETRAGKMSGMSRDAKVLQKITPKLVLNVQVDHGLKVKVVTGGPLSYGMQRVLLKEDGSL